MRYLLAGLCWLGATLAVWGDVEFDPPWIDLGTVKAGQVFQKEVRVTNVGTTPFQVGEIKSSCGCLHSKLQPEILQPGQTGTLSMKINTLSAPPGVQAWRVRLFTHEGGQTDFLIRAEVQQEIVISPAALTLYGDKASSHTITVTDRRAQALRLLSVTTTSTRLTAAVTSPTTVQLQIHEGFAEGRHEEEVILTTDDPQYPQLQFPVRIIKRSRQRFIALPKEVELQHSATQPLLSRIVTIRDQQSQPLTIDRMETSHPGLKAEVVSTQGASASLRISLSESALSSVPFTGQVIVHFRGTTEKLTIPVRCP
jgi:hypothetical protein